jgi:hypothetical protein
MVIKKKERSMNFLKYVVVGIVLILAQSAEAATLVVGPCHKPASHATDGKSHGVDKFSMLSLRTLLAYYFAGPAVDEQLERNRHNIISFFNDMVSDAMIDAITDGTVRGSELFYSLPSNVKELYIRALARVERKFDDTLSIKHKFVLAIKHCFIKTSATYTLYASDLSEWLQEQMHSSHFNALYEEVFTQPTVPVVKLDDKTYGSSVRAFRLGLRIMEAFWDGVLAKFDRDGQSEISEEDLQRFFCSDEHDSFSGVLRAASASMFLKVSHPQRAAFEPVVFDAITEMFIPTSLASFPIPLASLPELADQSCKNFLNVFVSALTSFYGKSVAQARTDLTR